MPPLSGRRPFVVRISAVPLRDAGPWHEAPDGSQMPIIARFAPIAAREPPLDPRTTRSVSYGLHGWPLQALCIWPPAGMLRSGLEAPPGSPGPPLNSCALDFAYTIAPFARSCATIVASNGGTSIAKLTSLFDVV